MTERQDRCENCRWWHKEGEPDPENYGKIAECRRAPPVVVPHSVISLGKFRAAVHNASDGSGICYEGVWPETHSYDFCGEFQPATPPEVKT